MALSVMDIVKRNNRPDTYKALVKALEGGGGSWSVPAGKPSNLTRVIEGEPISESIQRLPFLKALFEGGIVEIKVQIIPHPVLGEGLVGGSKGHGEVVARIRAYMGDQWMVDHFHVRDAGPIKASDINSILKEAERRGDIKVSCYVCGREPHGRQVLGFYMLPDSDGEYTRPGKEDRVSVIRICDPCKKLGMEVIQSVQRVRARVLGEHS